MEGVFTLVLSPQNAAKSLSQSHYIEVAQRDIFMEQQLRYGLALGPIAILKNTRGQL